MKGRFLFVILASLATAPVARAQQLDVATSAAQNFPALHSDLLGTPPLSETNGVVRKHVTVSGPMVQPFKSKRLGELPKRFWHLVNPFSPAEPRTEPTRTSGLSTRAWSTTAGWNPGRSAFPDPVTHEPTMSLISFTRTP